MTKYSWQEPQPQFQPASLLDALIQVIRENGGALFIEKIHFSTLYIFLQFPLFCLLEKDVLYFQFLVWSPSVISNILQLSSLFDWKSS